MRVVIFWTMCHHSLGHEKKALLIAYLFVCGPLARKMTQDRYISLKPFQSISLSLCRCLFVVVVVVFFSFLEQDFRVMEVRDTDRRTRLPKNIHLYRGIFNPFRSLSIRKSAYVNVRLFSTDNQSP